MKILHFVQRFAFFIFAGWAVGTLALIGVTPSNLWGAIIPWFWLPIGAALLIAGILSLIVRKTPDIEQFLREFFAPWV